MVIDTVTALSRWGAAAVYVTVATLAVAGLVIPVKRQVQHLGVVACLIPQQFMLVVSAGASVAHMAQVTGNVPKVVVTLLTIVLSAFFHNIAIFHYHFELLAKSR